jgi:hypothetical protein
MIKYIQIGQIYIKLSYQYHDYFKDALIAYETSDLEKEFRLMTIKTEETIELPKRELTFTFKNRLKMEGINDTYIVSKDGDDIKHMIYFTHDFKKIDITLNKKLGNRLAEFEYVISGMMFFEMALNEGYLPIHASCIHQDKYTFLLSGPSKSGKSTQTSLFVQEYPDSIIINEDKPLLFNQGNHVYVIGSPWSGKHVINKNQKQKLDKIFFLKQASHLNIEELSKEEKLKYVFRNIHRPGDEYQIDQMVKVVNQMIKRVAMVKFYNILDISSPHFIKEYLEENYEN